MTAPSNPMEAFEKALDDYARLERLDAIRISNAEAERVAAARSAVLRLYDEAVKGGFTRADVEQMREDSTFIRKFVGVDAAHLEQGEFEAIWQAGNRLDDWANRIEDAIDAATATDAASSTTDAGESNG